MVLIRSSLPLLVLTIIVHVSLESRMISSSLVSFFYPAIIRMMCSGLMSGYAHIFASLTYCLSISQNLPSVELN